jgi:hypothetical protein
MAENFDPITGLAGEDNMGGHKNYVLWVPANACSAVPTLKKGAAILTDADLVTAAGAFDFKDAVNGKPIYFEATKNSVKYDAANQGEDEGQSFAQTLEFGRAGDKVAYAAFARKYNNTKGYFVAEDMDGKQFMVGQPGLEATMKAEYAGGQKAADRRGYTVKAAVDSLAPKVYLGTPIDVAALIAE